jgi:hypothetical protein
MGGEVILRLAAGQRKAVDRLMKKVAPEGMIGPGCAHKEGCFPDCWYQWSGRDLQIGYCHSYGNSDWALAVAMAVCKRFKVVKAGWSCIGYCKDMAEFNRCRPFGHEVKCARREVERVKSLVPGTLIKGLGFKRGKPVTVEQLVTKKAINYSVKLQEDVIKRARSNGNAYVRAAEEMLRKAEASPCQSDKEIRKVGAKK